MISQIYKNRFHFLIERIFWAHCNIHLETFGNFFFVLHRVMQTHSVQKGEWRIWVSIPVPPACKAGALPFELIPPPGTPAWSPVCRLTWWFIALYNLAFCRIYHLIFVKNDVIFYSFAQKQNVRDCISSYACLLAMKLDYLFWLQLLVNDKITTLCQTKSSQTNQCPKDAFA